MATIKVYASKPEAFLVNSFLIETSAGIVLVDTQFLVSPARDVGKLIAESGKPLAAVIVTHPHPDHFNGLKVILGDRSDVPIYSSALTAEGIRLADKPKRDYWTPTNGDEYPKETLYPNRILEAGKPLRVGDTEIIMEDLGTAETSDNTILFLPQENVLIASDLIYNNVHPWLAEGHSAAWLDKLQIIKKRYSAVRQVYAGHGEPGGVDVFDKQISYIEFVRKQVAAGLAADELSVATKAKVSAEITSKYNGYKLEFLVNLNVDGVAGEIAGAK
jgi:glyoxylase-like metal-dependent hydrolase (beta-lactamase superfamily II)